ncbi:MAG TPA: 7-cyano-7-deazaguanine synthase QueC [Allosphingosinicella sp.]|nr:7-cyano-7-deazaguanine synthase QueC [Allosphingosinicella sp.]
MSAPAAIVLLSGGLDSMVAAGLAREAGFRLLALTVDYNQRHRIELKAAAAIAARLDVERHIVLPLDLSRFGGSALTGDIAVPKSGLGNDDGAAPASRQVRPPDEPKSRDAPGWRDGAPIIPVTYVPARNTIFLSLCLGWAEAAGARDIFIGVNALDYSGYPDCRPQFVESFEATANLATKAGVEGGRFTIRTPLIAMTKADIAREAARLGLEAGMSWSCYDPTSEFEHCGLCDSCRLRSKGFAEAGLPDPTRYAASSGPAGLGR